MHRKARQPVRAYEFHVSRAARERYDFDESLFSLRGNVIFANFHAARTLAQKINEQRDLLRKPEQAVSAAQLNALGLQDEILHLMIDAYRRQHPQVMRDALRSLDQRLGSDAVDRTLARFAAEFPPLAIHRGETDPESYLRGGSRDVPNREILLEEMLLLWVTNLNPAAEPMRELFDDTPLEAQTTYPHLINELERFFESQPGFDDGSANARNSLIRMLRAPALASPDSLLGQLEFLRHRYSFVLGGVLQRVLTSLDFIKEEEKLRIGFGGGGGGGPVEMFDFRGMEAEAERFTPDRDWMPRLVLIAKNAFVWLDQLSKQGQREIQTLDQVPDEELDRLARAGVTGLWLIGLWERSEASKRIKQMMGNADAVASAYSLYDYTIAHDLGGESAVDNLRERAWQRGIRLASDMVPNHMGIDSSWVINHPDRFLGMPYPPYPSYSFNGPDLSNDSRVGIFLEDHYYTKTDAAVVFKRVDRWSGEERYIYHGNDGTSMPWNDTAQLNYLDPNVREAVIQTILQVARQFPIIRFDAAMTLAKKHYQRLWFPEPGTGGDIPSRAEHGMTRAAFDQAMPEEFWREVVDRAAVEAPDTLLLAEAFWLMENYFVRTLGMHRVYNSAFMHILRDEDNAKYRQIMKQTLEFDPEIMKRWVNFMNNPDEQTAVAQFGKGDKYFGICTMLVTLPGLPMLGHGQIEGFAEKYGMEYRRAYWDEQPDPWLMQRHEREIFPLMHRRYLFAEAANFRLYDFRNDGGGVNEDVFAYSNRAGDNRAMVIYHNRYANASGWIKTSVAYAVKHADGDKTMRQSTLGEGLGVTNDEQFFTIFRDQNSGLEYIRSSRELHEQGLHIELGAYQSHVFLDFREARDSEWGKYRQLALHLNGRGVPSVEEAAYDLVLEPILQPFRELVNADTWQRLLDSRALPAIDHTAQRTPTAALLNEAAQESPAEDRGALLDTVSARLERLMEGIRSFTGATTHPAPTVAAIRRELESLLDLPLLADRHPAPEAPGYDEAVTLFATRRDDLTLWGPLLGWIFTHRLGELCDRVDLQTQSRAWIDEWRLDRIIASALQNMGLDGGPAWRASQSVKLLLDQAAVFDDSATTTPASLLESALRQPDVQQFLGVNRYGGVLYFSKEAFGHMLWWMLALTAIRHSASSEADPTTIAHAISQRYAFTQRLGRAEEQSSYEVDRLLAAAWSDDSAAEN